MAKPVIACSPLRKEKVSIGEKNSLSWPVPPTCSSVETSCGRIKENYGFKGS